MCKDTMFPNMVDVEQRNLREFNLNKAWISSMCTCGYRTALQVLGTA